jgi:hypothetical protein
LPLGKRRHTSMVVDRDQPIFRDHCSVPGRGGMMSSCRFLPQTLQPATASRHDKMKIMNSTLLIDRLDLVSLRMVSPEGCTPGPSCNVILVRDERCRRNGRFTMEAARQPKVRLSLKKAAPGGSRLRTRGRIGQFKLLLFSFRLRRPFHLQGGPWCQPLSGSAASRPSASGPA